MTNTAKMVEKNTVRQGSPAQGYSNRHRSNVKPRITKSTTYFQSIVTPSRVKHRKMESNQENVNNNRENIKSTEGAVFQLSSNAIRQSSPKLKHRASPSKEGSPRTSPTLGVFYAGAKFSEPPSPTALPKPPTHWTSCGYMASVNSFSLITSDRADKCRDISNQLKVLLNVSA